MSTTPSTGPAVHSVSDARFAKLARGINLSHWFAQAPRYEHDHFQSYITAEDVRLIKSMGFGHVRFTLNPLILLNDHDPATLHKENQAYVDAALGMILEQDLAVIVDLHPEDDFKLRLRDDDKAVSTFATFWHALAKHLSVHDPEKVFLEVLNEPVMRDAKRWASIQTQLLAAMRAGAPEHTLIATAHKWSSLTELLTLKPVADCNVVYNFHCYDPHIFTHQGSTWSMPYLPFLKYLPYSSSPQALEPMLSNVDDEPARQAAREYREERWDAGKIDAWIAQAAGWGQQHNVRLTCNEFGVYRRKSKPEHRNAWLRDVRTSLEQHNIGWSMWDYAGGFSVVTTTDNRREVDRDTAEALGLG